jgi:hypothetical protein
VSDRRLRDEMRYSREEENSSKGLGLMPFNCHRSGVLWRDASQSKARVLEESREDEQDSVGLGDGGEGGLDEVSEGGGVSSGLGIDVLNTGELEHPLGGGGGDDSGSAGGGNEDNVDGSDLAVDLAGDGVGLSELGTPVTSTTGDDGELRHDDGSTDGGSDLLGALDSESDVSVKVSDGDERLETGPLSGTGLLLDGHDLHDLVLESGEEDVDDLWASGQSSVRARPAGQRTWYSFTGREKR